MGWSVCGGFANCLNSITEENEDAMTKKETFFCENPYDIVALVEALSYMKDMNADYLLLDEIITRLRQDPTADLVPIIFQSMKKITGSSQNTKIEEVCYEQRSSSGKDP